MDMVLSPGLTVGKGVNRQFGLKFLTSPSKFQYVNIDFILWNIFEIFTQNHQKNSVDFFVNLNTGMFSPNLHLGQNRPLRVFPVFNFSAE